MNNLGFDPGAEVYVGSQPCELMEATLTERGDGSFVLKLTDDEGNEPVLAYLRSDFLDALIASRTREAAA